jgi:hypothetical protein
MSREDTPLRRDPPPEVKRILREEVGFGCPVRGCREPFLSWHHFDPPWRERKHHDPAGMIALCVKHHAMADRGVWSKDQLRAFKNSPHSIEEVKAKFEWARPRQLVRTGGHYMGGKQLSMVVGVGHPDQELIGLHENSEGLLEFSFELRSPKGLLLASMKNNMFSSRSDLLYDLSVDTGATKIKIRVRKKDVVLDMESRRITQDEFDHLLEEDYDRAIDHILKTTANTPGTFPVFRDYKMGSLAPLESNQSGAPERWRDKGTGEDVESREHLIEFIRAWALHYCLDDEGIIPLLDVRNLRTYIGESLLEVRNGVEVGPRGMAFGAYFSEDSPHPHAQRDGRPRRRFHV